MGDAKATFELFKLIQKKMNSNIELISDAKKLALPANVDREEFESLPHAIGVYYFYNSEGVILYIGKSLDIKKRISQHFHPDLKRRKDIELKNQIAKMSYTLFPHELAALVFECMEIKKHYPRYNHSLKRKIFPYALKLKGNIDGVYEILCTHNDGSFHPLFAVKSKKVGERRIEAIYKILLGPFGSFVEKEEKIKRLVSTLGVSGLNSMIEKIFYKRIPKSDEFEIPLKAHGHHHGFIKIEDFVPVSMVIRDKFVEEATYRVPGDPDLASIVCNYLTKVV